MVRLRRDVLVPPALGRLFRPPARVGHDGRTDRRRRRRDDAARDRGDGGEGATRLQPPRLVSCRCVVASCRREDDKIARRTPPGQAPARPGYERLQVIVLHEVAHSGHGEGPLKIVCYFCIDNFAWPSGDNIPLEKERPPLPRRRRAVGHEYPTTVPTTVRTTVPPWEYAGVLRRVP